MKETAHSWEEGSTERRVVTETKGGEMLLLGGSESQAGVNGSGEEEEEE